MRRHLPRLAIALFLVLLLASLPWWLGAWGRWRVMQAMERFGDLPGVVLEGEGGTAGWRESRRDYRVELQPVRGIDPLPLLLRFRLLHGPVVEGRPRPFRLEARLEGPAGVSGGGWMEPRIDGGQGRFRLLPVEDSGAPWVWEGLVAEWSREGEIWRGGLSLPRLEAARGGASLSLEGLEGVLRGRRQEGVWWPEWLELTVDRAGMRTSAAPAAGLEEGGLRLSVPRWQGRPVPTLDLSAARLRRGEVELQHPRLQVRLEGASTLVLAALLRERPAPVAALHYLLREGAVLRLSGSGASRWGEVTLEGEIGQVEGDPPTPRGFLRLEAPLLLVDALERQRIRPWLVARLGREPTPEELTAEAARRLDRRHREAGATVERSGGRWRVTYRWGEEGGP